MGRQSLLGAVLALAGLCWAAAATAQTCPGSPPCDGNGTCVSGTCDCSAGYNGSSCQYGNATTCSGHGIANYDGTCSCNAGFTGANCGACAANYYGYPNCTYCSAATTCSGDGICTGSGTCSCNTGFSGASCDACATNYYGPTCAACPACVNGGTCDQGLAGDGQCSCPAGTYGPLCQYTRAGTCSDHGTPQYSGSCVCDTGFTGATCNACATNYYGYPSCT
ncbi:MAG TPA: hypothetical protein VMB50_19490, partial [Myxococcales bacterium]|nr:hypothetical protein [Myxococcales bacterium]